VKLQRKIRRKGEQSGIALLLSIFVLLLVCVVGIAMLAASGTETSLSGNYRSSTSVYYAALSGLEEGRSRLLPQNPNSLNPAYIPAYGATLALGHAIYITNPSPGPPADTVDPTALGNPDQFPDTEWIHEFGSPIPSTITTIPSVNNLASMAGAQNALYKWVRINALTEQAIQIDVNNTNPGGYTYNTSKIIYFDGTNLNRNVAPYQALGITALAGLPDGSRKLLQYVVGPVPLGLQFNAALTMVSPGSAPSIASFNPPLVGNPFTFGVNGNDQCSGAHVPAIGVFNNPDWQSMFNFTSVNHPGQFLGTTVSNNEVEVGSTSTMIYPSSSMNWQDPVQLANLVQTIQNGADSVIAGPATNANMPAAMNSGNPMMVVVNGDLTLNSFTGYGLLLVTGKLTYTGDSGWKGIVLVIGQGTVEEQGSAGGGEFDGAVLVANITGGVLGATSWTVDNPGGNGIHYNSCWISTAQRPITYKVLSFREIPYP
jgi:hypothetical protein